ncbi:SWIM zinc finger family protein [Paenibacillus ginsengihumi]|uniref:SWIM zinc finger family protein n=1 Tax=Paenibacillus ginsengihumi TaxID=431596 RepID=UPI00035C8E7C|nr:hypothetical protein [Paenibacillus ginsengihumi]
MNIFYFEEAIDNTILDMGYAYYEEGRVVEVRRIAEHEYAVEVEGSDDYEVVVKLDEDGEIVYSRCDCPFDYGPVCKHEVAAYYELAYLLDEDDDEDDDEAVARLQPVKLPALSDVLNQLPKEELIEIIMELTQQNTLGRELIIAKYARGDERQKLEQCRKLIRAFVRQYQGRGGHIAYRAVADFAMGLSEVLEKARLTDNRTLALDIAFLVLEEALKAFHYADDSDGDIREVAREALEVIGDIADDVQNLDEDERKQVFDKLLEKSDASFFEAWDDFLLELIEICTRFADVETFRNRLMAQIQSLIRRKVGEEYSEFSIETLLHFLLQMTEQYGTAEEAEAFIKENLHYNTFREKYIGMHMQKGDFRKVVELALEGEAQDQNSPGLVIQWKEHRYEAYKAMSLREEQEQLAKELLLDGNFEYYSELKALVADQEALYRELKHKFNQAKGWREREMYRRLIESENDLDALMLYLKDNPEMLETYASRLVVRYRDEIVEMYRRYIRAQASSAANRRQYQSICRMLSRFGKIAGQELQQHLIQSLRTLYMRKRAFLEELDRLK